MSLELVFSLNNSSFRKVNDAFNIQYILPVKLLICCSKVHAQRKLSGSLSVFLSDIFTNPQRIFQVILVPPQKVDIFLKHGHQNCMDSITSSIDLLLVIIFLWYGQRGRQRVVCHSNLGH